MYDLIIITSGSLLRRLSKSKQLKSTTWYFLHLDVLKEKTQTFVECLKLKVEAGWKL